MRRLVLAAAALVLVIAGGASFALTSAPADALTPTPSNTATFTPTPVPASTLTATNLTGSTAIQLTGRFGIYVGFSPSGVVSVSPVAGCGVPVVTTHIVQSGAGIPLIPFVYVIDFHVLWPTACVADGTSVDLTFTFTPTPAVQMYTFSSVSTTPTTVPTLPPTQTPTPVPPTETPLPAGVSIAIDCDVINTGIQPLCSVPLGGGSTAVDVYFVNGSASAVDLTAFEFRVNNPDPSRLLAPSVACAAPALDCNPDFDQASLSGTWDCSGVPPTPDFEPAAPGQQSFIGCFVTAMNAPMVPAGEMRSLARVHYDIPPAAHAGSVPLTLKDVAVYGEGFDELGSCNPVLEVIATCLGAAITLVEAPTFTPTPTATYSQTPTATNTATPTPAGPAVEKQPEGEGDNADLSVPKANLWLCEAPAACSGPGEGALRVVEHAFGVQSDTDGDGIADGGDACICTGVGPDNTLGTADDTNPIAPPNTELGLGAYEFTVEYDNFVIASVNPCDLVFGPGGAGSGRGPVDELNTSAVNADCAPDPNSDLDGTCAYSLVLENLVHFGCVTAGTDPGPFGDFDLASLLLVPHPDLRNDIFPGNENGVLTVIKDNGCELVDTLGHPVFGSVNGGLTPFCRDLAVTVRILEGDVDLDCDVDLTDAQAIANRYGAFFGGLLYSKWFDLEPALHDLDIDIKDIQKVFGRQGSTCQTPVPPQPPLDPPVPFPTPPPGSSPTATTTSAATATSTPSPTATVAPPTSTATLVPPTATGTATLVPPTSTATSTPTPTPTSTPTTPPTATPTATELPD